MPAGRPKKWQSVEELEQAIESYFHKCDTRTKEVYNNKTGEVRQMIDPEPYTMSGLAYYLGIDRDTLLNYSKDDNFSALIKDARNRVHMDVERRLMESNATGPIFNLKNNFNWKDKQEVDQNNTGEQTLHIKWEE